MSKVILMGLVMLAVAGCGATMVKPVNTGSKYAPLNEGDGEGEVIYRLGRMDSFNESQREGAYKKMYEQCNGKYNVADEWTDSESTSSGFAQSTANATATKFQAKAQSQSTSMFVDDQMHYRHITFKCVQ